MISATASHSSNSTAQSTGQDSTQERRLGDPFSLESSASRAAPYRHEYLARLNRYSGMNDQARMDAMRNRSSASLGSMTAAFDGIGLASFTSTSTRHSDQSMRSAPPLRNAAPRNVPSCANPLSSFSSAASLAQRSGTPIGPHSGNDDPKIERRTGGEHSANHHSLHDHLKFNNTPSTPTRPAAGHCCHNDCHDPGCIQIRSTAGNCPRPKNLNLQSRRVPIDRKSTRHSQRPPHGITREHDTKRRFAKQVAGRVRCPHGVLRAHDPTTTRRVEQPTADEVRYCPHGIRRKS
ncbi:hypothetical protein C8R45DRAFT_1099053 [Mycena sanguinolenta]|nr:hypothetical protein C8R45DRAFT_1099053 [Mycena sanguinolenta]